MEGDSKRLVARCPCCGRVQNSQVQSLDPQIHRLVQQDKLEELCKLLEQGANVNAISEVDLAIPLHRAAEIGSTKCIELLIAHGSLIDPWDMYGNTPLHIAAENGHLHAVSLFLQYNGRRICQKGCRKCIRYCKLAQRMLQPQDEPKENGIGNIPELDPSIFDDEDAEEESAASLSDMDFMVELEKVRKFLQYKGFTRTGEIIDLRKGGIQFKSNQVSSFLHQVIHKFREVGLKNLFTEN